jgi:hypothetical protein
MTVHGTMPGQESWTCGLRTYRAESFLSVPSGSALAIAVSNRWRTLFNSEVGLCASLPGSRATVDGVTVREINDVGVTVTQYEGIPTVAQVDATAAASMPNQAALAVTLLTARAGRTGKGRIYLPCLNYVGVGAFAGGQITQAVINLLAPKIKTLLDGINTDLAANFGSALKLAVQSPTSAKKVFDDNSLADYNGAVITGFKIGSVIDTQRRRRQSIAESYTQGVLA